MAAARGVAGRERAPRRAGARSAPSQLRTCAGRAPLLALAILALAAGFAVAQLVPPPPQAPAGSPAADWVNVAVDVDFQFAAQFGVFDSSGAAAAPAAAPGGQGAGWVGGGAAAGGPPVHFLAAAAAQPAGGYARLAGDTSSVYVGNPYSRTIHAIGAAFVDGSFFAPVAGVYQFACSAGRLRAPVVATFPQQYSNRLQAPLELYLAVNAPRGMYSPVVPLHNGVELSARASGVDESVADSWTLALSAGDRVACMARSDENLNLRGVVPGASFFSGTLIRELPDALAAAAPQPSPPSPPFVAPTWQRRFSVAASATHIIVATGDGRVVTWGNDLAAATTMPGGSMQMRRSLAQVGGSRAHHSAGRDLVQDDGINHSRRMLNHDGGYVSVTNVSSPAALAGPEGLDLLFEGSADDASTPITVPFPFVLGNVDYGNGANGGIHLSSNAYLAFGGGASAYTNLGPSNPPFPTVFMGAGDNSYQRVYAGLEPGGNYRVPTRAPRRRRAAPALPTSSLRSCSSRRGRCRWPSARTRAARAALV